MHTFNLVIRAPEEVVKSDRVCATPYPNSSYNQKVRSDRREERGKPQGIHQKEPRRGGDMIGIVNRCVAVILCVCVYIPGFKCQGGEPPPDTLPTASLLLLSSGPFRGAPLTGQAPLPGWWVSWSHNLTQPWLFRVRIQRCMSESRHSNALELPKF